MAKVKAEQKTIAARDGYPLAATFFLPEGEPERAVIVACAMAVRRAFYEPYARFLAANGCAAVTFDYRGIGGSLGGPVTQSKAGLRDWGQLDYPAIIEAVAEAFPGKPLQIVGHSIGGQMVGMIDNLEHVGAVCTVAAQHAHWRGYPLWQALRQAAFWYLLIPILTLVFSRFPAKKFRMGEDVPKGVFREWSQFCRSPHYLVARDGTPLHAGFRAFAGPVVAYVVADDDVAHEPLVRKLHGLYEKADVEYRTVDPATAGAKSVGHIGFFFSKFKGTLWKDSLDWLRAH
jgi:predicted alpha/beta hydrolase